MSFNCTYNLFCFQLLINPINVVIISQNPINAINSPNNPPRTPIDTKYAKNIRNILATIPNISAVIKLIAIAIEFREKPETEVMPVIVSKNSNVIPKISGTSANKMSKIM